MSSDGVLYAREVMRDLREIVAEFGPDTKRKCQYLEYEDPQEQVPVAAHCIVGVLLNRHGVPLSVLMDCEGMTAGGIGPKIADYITIESGAAKILLAAQHTQDNDGTWGEALEEAQRECDEPGYYGRY